MRINLINFIAFLIGITIFTSCQSGTNEQSETIDQSDKSVDSLRKISKIKNEKILTEKKSAQTVIEFLKWYKKHYSMISKIEFVNNVNFDDGDSTKPYSVNYDETEKYLHKLKLSSYISEKYLEKWRKYFKEKDENFKKTPQLYGPPDGFEFDFVLWTQEIEGTIEAIDDFRLMEAVESITKSNVKINIGMKLSFSLSKQDNKWLIDDIENLGM